MEKILTMDLPGDSVVKYTVLFLVLLSISIILVVIKKKLMNGIRARFGVTENSRLIISLLEKTLVSIICFSAVYLASYVLKLNDALRKVVNVTYIFILIFFVINVVSSFVDLLISNSILKKDEDIQNSRTFKIVTAVIKILIWGIAAFVFLDNIGVNITSLVAGLGIGGVAVALAAQTILGDLFSCFIIYLDKPFEIGDFINIDSFSGTIEHIGIKTTRIRSLSGEQLVFSNSDLTTSRVRNYKRMEQRRINFTITVAYETGYDDLAAIPGILSQIIMKNDGVSFDRAHFSSYGEYGLVFDVVYYVLSNDYVRYMDIQQQINLEINAAFRQQGIRFAYPTQVVILRKTD